MPAFSAQDVKALRDETGVGMMDCKKALTECDGDHDKAVEYLRKKGLASAEKRAGRIAAEGVVGSYIHMGGKIGVLVEVNCESDFVANGDIFKNFVKDVAMQIAASNPRWINREDVPADVLDKEKEIYMDQARKEGKPEKMLEKIVEGKLVKKFYAENCLVDMACIKDDSMTIGELLSTIVSKTGEKVSIRRFTRYQMGEGLEKRSNDLAAEVAAEMAKYSN